MLVQDGIKIANSTNPAYVWGNLTEKLAKNLVPLEYKAAVKTTVIVGQVAVVIISPEPLSKALLINAVRQALLD